jgi:hypothetical protein
MLDKELFVPTGCSDPGDDPDPRLGYRLQGDNQCGQRGTGHYGSFQEVQPDIAGESCCAVPEPTTAATKNAVPTTLSLFLLLPAGYLNCAVR